MSLLEHLQRVPDPRRSQGERYSCISMLLMIIMGVLCGRYGYRDIGRFCQLHQVEFVKLFCFKNKRVPSYVSIRDFILRLDFTSLQQAFYSWAKEYVPIEQGQWLCIDGKSIRSTLSEYGSEYQNFVSLVSLFCAKREQILCVKRFENGKSSEIKVVEELLEELDLKGVVFSLDALHCKKNDGRNHQVGQPLPDKSKR